MGTWLPREIIEHILFNKNLSIGDVCNFSYTNRYHYNVVKSNKRIWMKKYFQSWPQYSEVLQKNNLHYNWFKEIKYIYNLKQKTRKILSLMSSRFYKPQRLWLDWDYTEWMELYKEKPQTYYYLENDLMNILNTHTPINSIDVVPITTPGNKTLQYYATIALTILRKLHFSMEFKPFMQKRQTLEKWTALIIQWYRPQIDVSWKKFAAHLDNIAEEIKKQLKMAYPDHPFFAVSKEKLKIWKNEDIKGNKYGDRECQQIAQLLERFCNRSECADNIIKELLGRKIRNEDFVKFISLVMQESVARRLGLKYEIMEDPYDDAVTLCLSQKYNVGEEDSSLVGDLPVPLPKRIIKVLVHLVSELPRSSIPIFSMIERFDVIEKILSLYPLDVDKFNSLAHSYRYFHKDLTWFIEFLMQQKEHADDPERLDGIINKLQQCKSERKLSNCVPEKIETKVRPPKLKYAVGMVMYHLHNSQSTLHGCCHYINKFRGQPCVCVICDWNPDELTPSAGLPIYTAINPNGISYRFPEDELEPAANETTRFHLVEEIGRHFSHVFQTHFVPNAEKEMEYPADRAVRHAYYQHMKDDLKLS